MLLVMATLVFRTSNKVSEMLGNVNTSNALSAFEKMEEKGETFRLSESSLNPCIAHFELKKKLQSWFFLHLTSTPSQAATERIEFQFSQPFSFKN